MSKMVVITGCKGFIGSHLTELCLEKGWDVYGIDKMTYAAISDLPENNLIPGVTFITDSVVDPWSRGNFTFIQEDICNLKRLPDCDVVINVAAESHVGNSIIDSTDFIRSNIDGVRNLLDLIRNKPDNVAERPLFFHFSTDEVYGDSEEFSTEESHLNPSNPYSASKASADMLIKAWARTYGIEYNILRPSNNYGTRQYPEKLIPLSVKILKRGKKIRLHNAGQPTRTWLHAHDTSQAVIDIIEKGKRNEIYNVSGEEEIRNFDVVKRIINCYFDEETSMEPYVDLSYKRPGQDVKYLIDDSKLRELGWTPKKKFDEEIGGIVNHYKRMLVW